MYLYKDPPNIKAIAIANGGADSFDEVLFCYSTNPDGSADFS